MVDDAVPPCVMVTDDGLAEIEKSGTTTVTDTLVVCVRVPSVPLTVMFG
jgi:hypothetical protein